MRRTLRLDTERLTELATTEMQHVVGGGPGTHITCETGLTVCGICDPHRRTH